ncbi:MAG: HAMP domain-containing protein [Anaerolineales bacterium]|nr:HAMP domain-containing protein [Anaerolineales bacterium]
MKAQVGAMSLRLKVALPFVILTMVVSVIGVYVVTRLVTGTLGERLTNQLLESGRVVSDSFIRQEAAHVGSARIVAYTEGVAVALKNEDKESLARLALPAFSESTIENLILISPQGNEIAHFLKDGGEITKVDLDTGAARSPLVSQFLRNRNPDEAPRRFLGVNLVNEKTYYFTALPVTVDGQFDGVIVVGTSIQTILPAFKTVALADIVLYGANGQPIATTLGTMDQETFNVLAISEAQYLEAIQAEEIVYGDNFEYAGRSYTLARSPLQIGNDRIGVFAVILPLDFVVDFATSNRNTYIWVFTLLTLVVIVIGYFVSRMIIVPLYKLVYTSQAIAQGDFDSRTGINSKDEIGTLASTFDDMTAKLQERTRQLEEANATLKQIDKTKTNFIQISAHELRTPLTLIMGYSQMLEQDTEKDPELQKLATGILEGAERMSDVVDSMLDVSRIDSDALFLRKTSIEIQPVINKVHRTFESAFEERNLKFKTEGLEKLPAFSADPDMLQKVFYHLIMNAIKYTPDGGEVKVVGKYRNGKKPPELEVAVVDTGIGVDPSKKEAIFEKFHQTGDVLLHSSGKTKFKGGGPGLGLAIARGIVQAHGGKIWVESKGYNEEKLPGSKFIVSFPLQKESEQEV